MQTAVKWKSWEELRTLTSAFQCYLQEIRETDIRRKSEIDTSLSRVLAAREQLKTAHKHKEEASEEAARVAADNAELRRQLEFDARQFVALLQSCAHLETQLAALKSGERAQEEAPQSTAHGDPSFGTAGTAFDASVDASPSAQDWKVSDGASAKLSDKEADSAADSVQATQSIERPSEGLESALGHSTADAPLQTADVQEQDAPSKERSGEESEPKDAEVNPCNMTSDASPATVVAATDHGDTITASPRSQGQASEAQSESRHRLLQTIPGDALSMLTALAAVKQRLLARSNQREPSISTCDGTAALHDPSPEHGQEDDIASTAMDSGTSRSSCYPGARMQDTQPLRPMESPRQDPAPLPDVSSPLRPWELASAEAARYVGSRGAEIVLPSPVIPQKVSRLCEPTTFGESRPTPSTASFRPVASHAIMTTPRQQALSPSRSAGSATGLQDTSYRLSPNAMVHPWTGQTGSPGALGWMGSRSPVSGSGPQSPTGKSAPSEKRKLSFQDLPAVPPLPFSSPRTPREEAFAQPLSTRGNAKPQAAQGADSAAAERADASYVATIQLVKELDMNKIPTTSSSRPPAPYRGLPHKQVQKLTTDMAKRREAPMSRTEGQPSLRTSGRQQEREKRKLGLTPRREALSSPASTKASL